MYYKNAGLTFLFSSFTFCSLVVVQWGQRETKNGNVKRLSETFCSKTISSSSYFKSDWALILPHILARCIISLTKYFQVVRFYSLSCAHVFFSGWQRWSLKTFNWFDGIIRTEINMTSFLFWACFLHWGVSSQLSNLENFAWNFVFLSEVKIAQFLLKEKFEVSKVLISTQRRRRLRHMIVIAPMHFFMLSELQFF